MMIIIMLANHFFTIILVWHLNCFIFSGNQHSSVGGTRLLWNNGENMVWEHISRCYFTDLELGLHQLPKLTLEHINLTSLAKTKVNLAVQVLSKSIGRGT